MWKDFKGELRFKVRVLLTKGYLCLRFPIIVLCAMVGAFNQHANALTAGRDTLRIVVTPGWNLISLALLVPDGRVSVLFPTSIYSAFEYQGSYAPRDTMQCGPGYWLKFSAAETVSVIGQLRANETLTLRKGWNLIGALSFPLPVSKLTQSPSNLVVSQFFTYSDNGYVTADTLEPGKAYWVKTSQPGTLSEYCWPSQGQALISPPDEHTSPSTPLLIWARSVCADNYRLQIGWDSLFTSQILDSTLTDTSYQVSSPCDTARQFWRVGMISSSHDTLWSISRSYRWGYVEQGLLTPGDNGGTTLTPTLKWRQTNCTGLYHLQLSTDSSFTTTLVDSLLADTLYQSGQLDSAETYHWRVGVSGYWTRTQKFIATWRYIGLGAETITALAADWADSNTMYAGSRGFIFKTKNAGATWDTLVRGIDVVDLDIHPIDSHIIYATGSLGVKILAGVLKSTDVGASWSRADSGIAITSFNDRGTTVLAIDPQHPETLYCGTGGPFGGPLYKSVTGGKYWFEIGLSNIVAIATDPINTNNLYVSAWSGDGGIDKTTDAGATWHHIPFRGMYPFDIVVNPNSTEYIYVVEEGFYFSSDSGWTLNPDNDGFQGTPSVHRILTNGSGTELYCSAGYIYRKRLTGESWKNIGIDGIGIDPILPNRNLLFAGYKGIYKYLR